MNCKKCGKEISMNERFCSYCGTENAVQVNAQSDSIFANDEIKPKKNITLKKVIVIVLAIIVGSFIGKNVIAPSLDSNSNNDSLQTQSTNQFEFETIGEDAVSMINPEYIEIFTKNNIAPPAEGIFVGLKSNSYVIENNDGIIDVMEIAYKDDMVYGMVSSIYLPISQYTDEQIDAFEAEIKLEFSSYQTLDCCDVTFIRMNSYYCVKIVAKNLDDEKNVRDLVAIGFVEDKSGEVYISMSQSEKVLIDGGYVKKYLK